MNEYTLIDNKGSRFTYQASDMRMALQVHHQAIGTDPVKCERPETEGEWYNRINGLT